MLRTTTYLTIAEKIQISNLWNSEYPKTLSFSDSEGLDNYLETLVAPNHYLLENESGEIVAWACKFVRADKKWFAIIIDAKIQGKNIGTEILNQLKANETILHAWVIDGTENVKPNGEVYKSPLNFYLKNDFKVYPQIRLENEKMSAVKIIWQK